VVTVTRTAHGFVVGDWVYLDFTSGTATDAWFEIATVPTVDTFTVTRTTATTSGNVTIHPPIIVTANNHGVTNNTGVYVDFTSGAMTTDQSYTARRVTTNTFQLTPLSGGGSYTTTPTATSGNVFLPQVGQNSFTYTKPNGCRAIEVALCGGGNRDTYGSGYSTKYINATSITTETVTVGRPAVSTTATIPGSFSIGGTTSFGAHCSATNTIGSGGDVNLVGGGGNQSLDQRLVAHPLGTNASTTVSACTTVIGVSASGFGSAGANISATYVANEQPRPGVVIVKEYY
jgi:hypothetical protein